LRTLAVARVGVSDECCKLKGVVVGQKRRARGEGMRLPAVHSRRQVPAIDIDPSF
jgi:hypothetical protein